MKRALSELLRVLAQDPEVLDAVRQFQSALMSANQGDEWIDQYRSPLCLPGQDHSRRHCNIVKRRIRNRLPGAYISPDGKQYFLTTHALAEECAGAEQASQEPGPTDIVKTQPDAAGEDGYEGMMRLIRGGRR